MSGTVHFCTYGRAYAHKGSALVYYHLPSWSGPYDWKKTLLRGDDFMHWRVRWHGLLDWALGWQWFYNHTELFVYIGPFSFLVWKR